MSGKLTFLCRRGVGPSCVMKSFSDMPRRIVSCCEGRTGMPVQRFGPMGSTSSARVTLHVYLKLEEGRV